ncbi:winged helix-turn-helix transcriptional regulator [Curtobacterium flaccumfaciens]|nr:winged helix-turn-helix transcriptional regulator [Curtobacterium flaccumfaciens]
MLDAVRRSPDGLSRVELASRTGLSAQTVSNVTRFLIEAGMIAESGTVVSGRGKPRTILRLEAGSRYAVGVHVDPAVVTYVLLDLAGTVVASTTTSTPTADDPSEVVRTITTAVDGLVTEAQVDVDAVLGVGIASPGRSTWTPASCSTHRSCPVGATSRCGTRSPTPLATRCCSRRT